MNITRAEVCNVTITLTLTEQEAKDLKVTAGYDSTIPKAIRRAMPIRGNGKLDSAAAERILQPLYDALDSAGI